MSLNPPEPDCLVVDSADPRRNSLPVYRLRSGRARIPLLPAEWVRNRPELGLARQAIHASRGWRTHRLFHLSIPTPQLRSSCATSDDPGGHALGEWGDEVFRTEREGIIARGVQVSEIQLSGSVIPSVESVLRDLPGRESIEELLRTLPETNFQDAGIREFLEPPLPVDEWRVGEAVAEAYLGSEVACSFPWRSTRDLKNPRASPAGVDLVGFVPVPDGYSFAFAEVKTPLISPTAREAVHGKSGLVKQILDIRDQESVRSELIRYLGYRATGAAWREIFEIAARAYLCNRHRVAIFGVLVREDAPDVTVLDKGTESLSTGRHPTTRIELHAMFFPDGAMARILSEIRTRGRAAS